MFDTMMPVTRWNVGALASAAVVCSCLATDASAQRPRVRADRALRDTSAFALLLETLRADTVTEFSTGPLRVDARPLRNDRNIHDVDPEEWGHAKREEMTARRKTIRALGMVVDKAELPRYCGATLVPLSVDVHGGCPSKGRQVVVIGWPRRADALAPGDATPDTTRWTARVLRWGINPGGYNVFSADYVIERRDGRWQFVGMRPVGWVE